MEYPAHYRLSGKYREEKIYVMDVERLYERIFEEFPNAPELEELHYDEESYAGRVIYISPHNELIRDISIFKVHSWAIGDEVTPTEEDFLYHYARWAEIPYGKWLLCYDY